MLGMANYPGHSSLTAVEIMRLLILVGVSCFSVYSYSSRLKCYFGFSNAMTGTTLAIFIYGMWVDKFLSSISDNLGLIGLTVIFQMMVRYLQFAFTSFNANACYYSLTIAY